MWTGAAAIAAFSLVAGWTRFAEREPEIALPSAVSAAPPVLTETIGDAPLATDLPSTNVELRGAAGEDE